MKQLFQACLTWGENGEGVARHDLSAYTDEEHLSGNRKRLTQLRKRTDEMSGQFPAQRGVQIDCNPPSTAVAATSASYTAPAVVELSAEDEQYIESLANILHFPEVKESASDFLCDPIAAAAAKVASKITLAISTDMSIAPVSPTSESARPEYIDPNVITAELPILNFQPPPQPENKSGLSGSFRRQNTGEHKMSHWKTKKAGTEAWDSRVETGVKAYEVNSKYTSSHDDLPVLIEPADGCSFIEMDRPEDAPAIQSFNGDQVKMITNYDNQGAGIRRLSSMRNSFKMLECRDEVESAKPVEPSNSYDAFNSFVSYKSTDSEPQQESFVEAHEEIVAETIVEATVEAVVEATVEAIAETNVETTLDTAEALSIIEELLQETSALAQEIIEPVLETSEQKNESIIDALEESFDDLLSECYEAAKGFEGSDDPFDNTNETNNPLISFAPEQWDNSIVENYAGNFSVTIADSLAICELSDIARIQEQMCFDPKSFVPQTVDGEPIEAMCVFDSERLSFNAAETVRTELESLFNMDTLSQVDEDALETTDVEIESVAVVSMEDCEVMEIAAVGGKPSRQKAKGTSRSKKTQTRKEKKSKKRATAANA